MDTLVPFASPYYCLVLSILIFSRGMDFLSTWIATPNLLLEANPIARRIGWRVGIWLNLVICAAFAFWPLPALVIVTTSLLVAARNFNSAWLMRSLGEERYRSWVAERLRETHFGLYVFCLLAQSALLAGIGGALMFFSQQHLVPFAIGMGIVTYAVALSVYTLMSVWRIRRSLY